MADTLLARASGHYWCDELLEPADDLIRRCTLRHAARASWMRGDFSNFMKINNLVYSIQSHYFGQAWVDLEAHNSCLDKRRVHSNTLAQNIEILTQFLTVSCYA